MLIHELTAEQCWAFLAHSSLGRLACTRADQPYIVPISYSFDADQKCLYGFSTVGQKIAWMRENPKVCVEVEELIDRTRWTTVLIFGRYDEIGNSPADSDKRQRVWNLFQQRPDWWLPAAAKVTNRDPHAMVIYRITIDRVSGRRSSGVDS
jgi:nitroimidazol reductase NimA-like FMN-containing flavoprotein (pyridoxamine 5'-phosphate oxidase superfamily)